MRLVDRRLAVIVAVTLAAGAVGAGVPARVPLTNASGPNAVTQWSVIAQNAWLVARPGTSGLYVHTMVHAAIYDAVVAIEGGGEPFVSSPSVTRPADADAAVAAAAREILAVRTPTQAAYVDGEYASYLAGIPDGPAKTNGIVVGQAAAAAVLADRAGDGLDAVVPYVQPTPGPGVFEPVAPSTPADVKIGQVRPFTIPSATTFRPDPPPALTSAQYATDFNETKALGGIDSTVRTAEQTIQARFWSDNPFAQWNRTLRNLAIERGLSRAETARFLAMVAVANTDALITCFEAKYHYMAWRPLHAIQRADTDGNPATEADPGWHALLTVNHPEYPSGHGCASGAILEAIRAFFGTGGVRITVSSTTTGTTRVYQSLGALRHDIFMARIYGGLHFRSTMEAGFLLGKQVGRYVVRNAFGTGG